VDCVDTFEFFELFILAHLERVESLNHLQNHAVLSVLQFMRTHSSWDRILQARSFSLLLGLCKVLRNPKYNNTVLSAVDRDVAAHLLNDICIFFEHNSSDDTCKLARCYLTSLDWTIQQRLAKIVGKSSILPQSLLSLFDGHTLNFYESLYVVLQNASDFVCLSDTNSNFLVQALQDVIRLEHDLLEELPSPLNPLSKVHVLSFFMSKEIFRKHLLIFLSRTLLLCTPIEFDRVILNFLLGLIEVGILQVQLDEDATQMVQQVNSVHCFKLVDIVIRICFLVAYTKSSDMGFFVKRVVSCLQEVCKHGNFELIGWTMLMTCEATFAFLQHPDQVQQLLILALDLLDRLLKHPDQLLDSFGLYLRDKVACLPSNTHLHTLQLKFGKPNSH